MARYIDADKFAERIKVSPAFPNMGFEGHFLRNVVLDLLDNAPTADVAPKSEVAKEIFEEIEFDIAQLDFDREETRAIAIEGIIAALKKKYTEGET